MKVWLIIAALVAAGAAASFYGYEYWRGEQQAAAEHAKLRGQLELLVADVDEPADLTALAQRRFHELGCKEQEALAPQGTAARLAAIVRLSGDHSELAQRLREDEAPAAAFVLAMLMQKNLLAKSAPAVLGLDPEALLRRAAEAGHPHASFYFARLEAESEPAWAEGAAAGKAFGELNRRLQAAADQGSGGAAFLLGLRANPQLYADYAKLRPAQRSRWQELAGVRQLLTEAADDRVALTSRSARQWWCRSAELGHAGGQLHCFRYGQRPRAEALRWLTLASDGGEANASFGLAKLYAEGGLGLARDEKKAIQLYCRSHLAGHPDAERALTKLYAARALEARLRLVDEQRLGKMSPKARQAELERRKRARQADERRQLERQARRDEAFLRPPPLPTPSAAASPLPAAGPSSATKPSSSNKAPSKAPAASAARDDETSLDP